jgi:hypothetical protein
VGKRDRKRSLGRTKRRWEDKLKRIFQKREGRMHWIDLAQDRDRWRALVYVVTNLRGSIHVGNFLTSQKPIKVSERPLFRGVSYGVTHVIYKVVQIWPGWFLCKQVTVCPGHISTTLYTNVAEVRKKQPVAHRSQIVDPCTSAITLFRQTIRQLIHQCNLQHTTWQNRLNLIITPVDIS